MGRKAGVTAVHTADVARMEAQLEVWGTEIHALADRSASHAQGFDENGRSCLEELDAQRASLYARFKLYKEAGDDTWEAFQPGIEAAWNDLTDAIEAFKNAHAPDRRL